MADKSKDETPRVIPGKPHREPPTIDLAPSEVVEETAPLSGHAPKPPGKPAAPPSTPSAKPEASAKADPAAGPGKGDAATAAPQKHDTAKSDAGASGPAKAEPAKAPASTASPSAAPSSPGKPGDAVRTGATGPNISGKVEAGPGGSAPRAEPAKGTASAAGGASGGKPSGTAGAATAAPAAAASAPVPPTALGRVKLVALLLGAVAGGVFGVAGGLTVAYVLSSPSDVAARITALDRSVDQRLTVRARQADVDTLRQQVISLRGEVDVANRRLAALAEQATAAPSAPQASASAAPTPGASATGDSAPRETAADAQALATLTAQVDKLAQAVQPVGGLSTRLAALETAVRGLDSSAARTAGEALAKAGALDQRLAAIEKVPADARVAELVRALLAMDVLAAIEAGRPFAAEVTSLRTAGVGGLTSLEQAKGHVATLAQLRRSFAAVADKTVAAAAPAGEGIMDRLAASAARVVRIKPIEPDGGTPAGTVDGIEAALDRGDLTAALASWKALPEPARRVSASFGSELQTRVEAEAAARAVLARAVAALGPSAPEGSAR